ASAIRSRRDPGSIRIGAHRCAVWTAPFSRTATLIRHFIRIGRRRHFDRRRHWFRCSGRMFACPGFASAIVIGLLFLNRLLAFLRNVFLWVCGDLGLFFLVILIWYFAGALLGGDDRLR